MIVIRSVVVTSVLVVAASQVALAQQKTRAEAKAEAAQVVKEGDGNTMGAAVQPNQKGVDRKGKPLRKSRKGASAPSS